MLLCIHVLFSPILETFFKYQRSRYTWRRDNKLYHIKLHQLEKKVIIWSDNTPESPFNKNDCLDIIELFLKVLVYTKSIQSKITNRRDVNKFIISYEWYLVKLVILGWMFSNLWCVTKTTEQEVRQSSTSEWREILCWKWYRIYIMYYG
jgi:hypothetical protein